MICSQCGEITSPNAMKCVHCGLVAQKSPVRRKNQRLICPSCEAALDHVRMSGLDLDLCPRCTGVWFDKGEITEFTKKASTDRRAKSFCQLLTELNHKSGRRRIRLFVDCPICGLMMDQKILFGTAIKLDRCRQHGIWADFDKCAALLKVIDQRPEGLKPNPRPKGARPKDVSVVVVRNSDNSVSKAIDFAEVGLRLLHFFI